MRRTLSKRRTTGNAWKPRPITRLSVEPTVDSTVDSTTPYWPLEWPPDFDSGPPFTSCSVRPWFA
ncbi:MAG: hypothetical protein ABI678_18205, partial [Kofleriaceae bacterium]